MGLIQVALGAISSTAKDAYKEFFYCDAIPEDVLVVRGRRHADKNAHNNGNENVISNGSGIAVADGQCMIIVDNGNIVDVVAEPGEYKYDTSSSPSIFAGSLGQSIKDTFAQFLQTFSHGGDTGKEQRVYYFNIKEITGNMFGTPNPVPFRVVDNKIGLDIDVSLRCHGTFTFKITDPILFYKNVCGNVAMQYDRKQIEPTLKSEFVDALQPALAKISAIGVRYSEIPLHTEELKNGMNEVLTKKWAEQRGISIASIAINSATLSKEDEDMIKQAQKTGMLQNATYAAATMVNAQAQAMQAAANNAAGAMNGFMGVNMAQQAGGINAQDLFAMGAGQNAAKQAASADSWTCSCGTVNTGKFCSECASPKPAPAGQWTCSCGTVNTGKFCSECASPRPASGEWTCSCGAVNTGKFCSECASPRP